MGRLRCSPLDTRACFAARFCLLLSWQLCQSSAAADKHGGGANLARFPRRAGMPEETLFGDIIHALDTFYLQWRATQSTCWAPLQCASSVLGSRYHKAGGVHCWSVLYKTALQSRNIVYIATATTAPRAGQGRAGQGQGRAGPGPRPNNKTLNTWRGPGKCLE